MTLGKFHSKRVKVTQHCIRSLQARFNDQVGGTPSEAVLIPEPPKLPLRDRLGIHIKYYLPPVGGGGSIQLFGNVKDPTGWQSNATYPIEGNTGPAGHTKKERRKKQMFLPVTHRIRLFVGSPSIEGVSLFEVR